MVFLWFFGCVVWVDGQNRWSSGDWGGETARGAPVRGRDRTLGVGWLESVRLKKLAVHASSGARKSGKGASARREPPLGRAGGLRCGCRLALASKKGGEKIGG